MITKIERFKNPGHYRSGKTFTSHSDSVHIYGLSTACKIGSHGACFKKVCKCACHKGAVPGYGNRT